MEVYKILTSISYTSSNKYSEDQLFHKLDFFTYNAGVIIHDPDSGFSYPCCGHDNTKIFLGTEEAIAFLRDSKINVYSVRSESSMWGEIDYFNMRRDAMGVFHARHKEHPGFNLILGPPDVLTHELFRKANRFFSLIQPRYTPSQPTKQAISELAEYVGYFGPYPI